MALFSVTSHLEYLITTGPDASTAFASVTEDHVRHSSASASARPHAQSASQAAIAFATVSVSHIKFAALRLAHFCLANAYYLALLALFVFGLARVTYINA